MWKLTIQDDQGNETLVHLVRDDYTIGRSEENAVRLTERNVSRKHARITFAEGAWHLHDLTSYNGCYVNGARVADAQNLAHGDLIQLGDYRLTVEDDALVAARENGVLTLPGRSGKNMQADRLIVLSGPGQGQEFVLTGQRAVIGRGEECEVPVNHPSVSRVHAEVRPIGDGRYEVVDLGSANGVRVNGVELPNSLLDARDVIELGDVILKFLPAGEIYIPGADETFHPPPVSARGGLSTWSKVGIGAGLVVATGAVLLAMALGGNQTATAPIAQSEGDVLGRTLSDAKGLLARGDAQAAMEKAEQIPISSNLRNSADFKLIQSAWADDLFGKAAASSDASEKRSLLDRIARSATLDTARRKRAASELDAMRQAAVSVTDLPSEQGISVESGDSAAPAAPIELDDEAKPGTAPKTPPAVAGARPPALAGTPAQATAKASAAPKAGKPPASGATLVRQNPFDDP
jgi:ABC transport system ATP-binding/permease protein